MVEDRITDAERIAELLASELTGLAEGPLEAVSVESPDRDAVPEPGGRFAYDVVAGDRTVGSVLLHPEGVELRLVEGRPEDVPVRLAPPDGLDSADEPDGGTSVWIDHGAAVKSAVDVLVVVLESGDTVDEGT